MLNKTLDDTIILDEVNSHEDVCYAKQEYGKSSVHVTLKNAGSKLFQVVCADDITY